MSVRRSRSMKKSTLNELFALLVSFLKGNPKRLDLFLFDDRTTTNKTKPSFSLRLVDWMLLLLWFVRRPRLSCFLLQCDCHRNEHEHNENVRYACFCLTCSVYKVKEGQNKIEEDGRPKRQEREREKMKINREKSIWLISANRIDKRTPEGWSSRE